ncbi:MAG TPA: hypothetical protein VMV44_02320 [Rectinemataceae bacterium]|nr:hypothetical protein [Rectinemataceae bacterium]
MVLPRIGERAAVALVLAAILGARPAMAAGLVDAILPATIPGLVWAEGEDAVSSNMATQPTFNFTCSGKRALQLSRLGQLPGGNPYYAEYGVYVEAKGHYELWYCGTPPASKDEFATSLASPFSVIVDGTAARQVYREDVNVVGTISPGYYWVRTFALDLDAGPHVIRFEVNTKRKLDDRYFFYLDSFFLATPETLTAAVTDRAGLPEKFPLNPADRGIDKPWKAFEDLQAQIQTSPSVVEPYVELANEYSLAGDYLDALKTLAKAALVAPREPEVRLLQAKNRIWRGDIKEGLDAYGIYLGLRPDDLNGWEEAGKVAAWTGRFSDSEYFYTKGLEQFPGKLSLDVNLGLSLLWAGRVSEADLRFAKVEAAALASPEGAASLASIYRENGLPEKAMKIDERALASFPDHLQFSLDKAAILASMGRDDEAAATLAKAQASYSPTPELEAIISAAKQRARLKADRIAALEKRILEKPADLGLRDELTRVYAWNGRKTEAVRELESLLAARFALSLGDSDAAATGLFSAHFRASVLASEAEARIAALGANIDAAQAAQAKSAKLLADLGGREAAAAAATAAGKTAPSLDEARKAARDELLRLAEAVASIADQEASLSTLEGMAASSVSDFSSIAKGGEEDDKAFHSIIAALGWRFEPEAAAAELAGPAARGDQLASLARARLLLAAAQGDGHPAFAALQAVRVEALAADRERALLVIEARIDPAALRKIAGTLPPPFLLSSASAALAAIAGAQGSIEVAPEAAEGSDGQALSAWAAILKEDLASLAARVAALRDGAQSARSSLMALAKSASLIEDRRLARAWYDFENAALELRTELGSYYDSLDLPAKATLQYRKVLALDPGNIPALYSLALAEDKSGDWAGAAAHFKAVDAADPGFESAAALHNGIARRQAPSYEATSSFLADLNHQEFRARTVADFPAGSWFSIRPSATATSIRDRYLGFPAYLAIDVGAEAKIRLDKLVGTEGLTLRPSGNLVATSADYAAYGATTLSPAQFLGELSLLSGAGLGLDFDSGSWSGSLSWDYGPILDSLNPATTPLFQHAVSLSAGAWYPLAGPLRYASFRTSISGGYVPADGANLYGSALLEAIPAFRVLDRPWANLGLPLDIVYEDSKQSRNAPYYAANRQLTLKGGILWQSTHTLSGGDSLSLTAEVLGGAVLPQAFSSSSVPLPYAYLFLRSDWARAEASYSLSLEVAATDPLAASPAYWSLALIGGASLKTPDLLAP